ncbi:CoA transferase [Ottowia sp. VDI28]|uniref:CoA transferase n=1 Tax=Ottowia sp. VDI28 TaxID=3133968 RepID=UPI003C2C0C17
MSLLEGVRILSVEQYGAGPFGTAYLAAMGAEVIKIEQPEEGEMSRVTWGPTSTASCRTAIRVFSSIA